MFKLILIYTLFPILLYSKNIGSCGGKFFIERQKMVNRLVLQIREADKEAYPYKKKLIEDFGYIGIENIIRYKEDSLNDVLITLLEHMDFYVKYKSLYALRHYEKYKKKNAQFILPFLDSEDLYLKDMAISTLTETGDKSLIPAFRKALKKATNEYMINSLKYATNKIIRDSKLLFPDFNYGMEKEKLLKYEYYKMGDKIKGYKERFSQIYLKKIESWEFPGADSFTPPILDYYNDLAFKGKRRSFGAGGSTKHVGDDCAWFRDGASVHAIAGGIVRIIHHSPDWGFLIVIEHRLKDDKYLCSVYGHLSKEIYIKAGDRVKKGDKIGTIGLSYSVENGGYGAHLHFGISKGRWLKSKYDHARNISIQADNKELKVKEYRFSEKGTELIFEEGLTLLLSDSQKVKNAKGVNNYLFWLKGYEFSKDVDRLWLDPYEFFEERKKK